MTIVQIVQVPLALGTFAQRLCEDEDIRPPRHSAA